MKQGAGIVAGLAAWTAAAAIGENPYQAIAIRNAFALRPEAVVAPLPPPVPPAVVSDVKITGITTMLGAAKAAFQCQDAQTKKVEYTPLLGEGDNYGTFFSVVLIDTENNCVRINQGGREATLDFVKNGVKPPAGPSGPPLGTVSFNPPPTAVSNSHVIVVGRRAEPVPPGSSASPRTMTPEEVKAALEKFRERQRAELNGPGNPGQQPPSPLPPTPWNGHPPAVR